MSQDNPFPLDDYKRYGRQMILDGFGLPGQLKLSKASVMVVGAGGLGCPALQYLGAAGVGKIGIVDHDRVEVSNLQRQIIHSEETIGWNKAESAALALKRLNPRLNVDVFPVAISSDNALSLLGPYDIILDCSDNAPTRYLLSDASVILGKPLVSGAAQKYEGQLCVYNLAPDGPCYRCLFPVPPPLDTLATCEETGILGVVTGVIGNMQALEAIKIITGLHNGQPPLLLFSSLSPTPFRSVKMRSKKSSCPACGTRAIRSLDSTDYVAFCGGAMPDWEKNGLLDRNPQHRVSVQDLSTTLEAGTAVHILDVRPQPEFSICQIPSSTNVPLRDLMAKPQNYLPSTSAVPTFVICRLGNDSQVAAQALRQAGGNDFVVKDVMGGLRAWAKQIDENFPVY